MLSQHSVRLAARRSALDAQAELRKERADRERRLEAPAIAVLTALGERDALVRDAERRAGQALRTMINNEGLSVRGPSVHADAPSYGAESIRSGGVYRAFRRVASDHPPAGSRPKRTTPMNCTSPGGRRS